VADVGGKSSSAKGSMLRTRKGGWGVRVFARGCVYFETA
jgi:hypothetical protein